MSLDENAPTPEKMGVGRGNYISTKELGDSTIEELQDPEGFWNILFPRGIPDGWQSSSNVVNILSSSIGPASNQAVFWAHMVLKTSARIANAVGTIENFADSPIGRFLSQAGDTRQAKYNAYWEFAQRQIEFNINRQTSRAGATSSNALYYAGLGPTLTENVLRPGLERSMERAGELIEREVTGDINYNAGNKSPRIDAVEEITSGTLNEAGSSVTRNLLSPSRWYPTSEDSERAENDQDNGTYTYKDRDGNWARIDRREYSENLRRRIIDHFENTLYNNDARIDKLTGKIDITTPELQKGDITVNSTDSSYREVGASYNIAEFYDDSNDAAPLAGDNNFDKFSPGGTKNLAGTAVDFLNWANFQLRWGNEFTHLFNVYIYDSVGYSEDPEGPNVDSLDFTSTGFGGEKFFSFAATGVEIGSHDITTDKAGILKTPLPTDASYPETITLRMKDYKRMPIYQYLYSWYLHWYNPHKRRWVPGKFGKYKNIKIEVQSIYGLYADESGNITHAQSDDPARQEAAEVNNRYKTFLTITALNCTPQSVPGLNLNYNEANPFEFDIVVEPADVFYDFDNPDSIGNNLKRHHDHLYERATEEAHRRPESIYSDAGGDDRSAQGSRQ